MGMRMTIGTTALLATISIMAAGCNKPAQKAEDAASKSVPAAAEKLDEAKAYPLARKPGLWLINNTVDNAAAPIPMTICVDAALGKKVSEMVGPVGEMECSQHAIRNMPNGAVFDQVCKMSSGTTMTSHVEIVSASDAAFRQTVNSTYSPAFNGLTSSKTVLDAQWQGACPADMKAGDMRMQGMTVNFYQMVEAAKAQQ